MSSVLWHNDQWVYDPDPRLLSPHDRLRLGEAVFNTVLCLDGQLIHGALHFQKLIRNGELFFGQWDHPTAEAFLEIAHELLQKNEATQGRYALNCIITGGVAGGGLALPQERKTEIIMRCVPYQYDYSQPVKALISQNTRRNEGSPLSRIKTAHYGDNIIALQEAMQFGCTEALLQNNQGYIACATTSNLVMIENDYFVTPVLSDGAQNGVARSILIEKYPVIERSIRPQELMHSDGVYLINSVRGAVPVHSIDGQEIAAPRISLDTDFHFT